MANRSGPLRAVGAEDRAPKKPKTLKSAAEMSERDLLVTMRDRIADEIDGGVPPHTLAPLSRQLREIDKEIRLLDQRAAQLAEEEGGNAAEDAWDSSAI